MNILGDMATVESSVASKAYSIGDYIVLDSYFYKVTAAIAQGDTFVEGTNIEKTNVGAEVSQLNSNIKKGVPGLSDMPSDYYINVRWNNGSPYLQLMRPTGRVGYVYFTLG